MKSLTHLSLVTLPAVLLLSGCAALRTIGLYKPSAEERLTEFRLAVVAKRPPFDIPPQSKIDTVKIDSVSKVVELHFNAPFSYVPYRPENVRRIYEEVGSYFEGYFEGFTFSVRTLRRPIEELIPNYFRGDTSAFDRSRMPAQRNQRPVPVIQNVSKPFTPHSGLLNRNIGLWPSHGWYYNNNLNRWEWQRPRLFLSVEDLIPTAFTLPYLVPMLENAGANVFVPRERDIQTNEIVVDNDSPASGYGEASTDKTPWSSGTGFSFGIGNPPYGSGVNPFRQGTHRVARSDTTATAVVIWMPDIPETGEYNVTISYCASDSNVSDAHYVLHHLGGTTAFKVNQTIGGNTWLSLGKFRFRKGQNAESGSLVLTNVSGDPGKLVSADAVRFGGGLGVVARNGQTSGRPKFVEGSRYFLQFAGMPDTLVYSFSKDSNDYRDDYQSRAEYLNYLSGAPFGPNKQRDEKGLGIPIDLSLAWHTDAGITNNDTTVGTLAIYSLQDAKMQTVFPDSMSRMANRDLADILQTQIVSDLRSKYDPAWSRRQLRNADYSEAVRPNMPSVLLELLSHQNFLDMKFMLDPRFRFDVARSVYKSIVRFLAAQESRPYTIQPLPVTHFVAELDGYGGPLLRWRPASDPLEPTANARRYIVSTRIHEGGFDNGTLVDTTSLAIRDLKPGVIYSFKVTAVNDGGESFPSEVLAVCHRQSAERPVLIVNGFDRISGPGVLDAGEFQGFLSSLDRGVPDRYDLGFTGEQFDLRRSSDFRTNDGPGHGASFADHEANVVAGNSFDYPFVHGSAISECGLSFSSSSDEAIEDSVIDLNDYPFVDLILGKEKETRWPKAAGDLVNGTRFKAFSRSLQAVLRRYCENGGSLFLSGSYIGTELYADPRGDSASVQFARTVLHIGWATGHAARTGRVMPVDSSFFPAGKAFTFNTENHPTVYGVEAPDALVPVGGGRQIFRYAENHFGAGAAFKKGYSVVALGFPFETILDPDMRRELMRSVLRFADLLPRGTE